MITVKNISGSATQLYVLTNLEGRLTVYKVVSFMTGTKKKTRQREHMINHENNLKAMNRSRRHEHNQTKPNLKPKPNQSCI